MTRRLLTISAITILAAAVRGQVVVPLEPVDQAIADLDPLATSQRDAPLDQRLPANFDRLFRVPARSDLVMRVDGALYAVFPRSLYEQTRIGPVPIIPNDTIFHIGSAGVDALADAVVPAPDSGAAQRVDRRIERSTRGELLRAGAVVLPPVRPSPPADVAMDQGTIANDPAYRARRVRLLMRRAVDAVNGIQVGAVEP